VAANADIAADTSRIAECAYHHGFSWQIHQNPQRNRAIALLFDNGSPIQITPYKY
jgi:hypothetical protein